MDKTIKWYKIKCSFYKQEVGIRLWKDVIDFLSKNIGFNYTIEGQTSEIYEGVEAYYENGEVHNT